MNEELNLIRRRSPEGVSSFMYTAATLVDDGGDDEDGDGGS